VTKLKPSKLYWYLQLVLSSTTRSQGGQVSRRWEEKLLGVSEEKPPAASNLGWETKMKLPLVASARCQKFRYFTSPPLDCQPMPVWAEPSACWLSRPCSVAV